MVKPPHLCGLDQTIDSGRNLIIGDSNFRFKNHN